MSSGEKEAGKDSMGALSLRRSSSSRYDVFMKELMEGFSREVLEALLGVHVESLEPLGRELPRVTVSNRRVDFLAWVKYKVGFSEKKSLFHVEFQSSNDSKMLQRMLRYGVDIWEKHGVFPSQIVIYIGREPLSMSSSINFFQHFGTLSYSFELVDISKISASNFLASNEPDVVLLAVLSNYENKKKEELLFSVLSRLSELCPSRKELIDSMTKLELVSELRGLSELVYEKVSEVFGIDVTELKSYKLGKEEGVKEGVKEGIVGSIVTYLRKKFGYADEELNRLTNILFEKKEEELKQLFAQLIEINELEKVKELLSKI